MDVERHIRKIENYERVIEKLDPMSDFELWMWAQMNSATNALNALLHHLGITEPGTCYSHQIPGVYVEPAQNKGEWVKVILPPGDIIHVDFPPLPRDIPEELSPFLEHLSIIEGYRETHVRGDAEIQPDIIDSCRSAYCQCMSIAQTLLGKKEWVVGK